MLWQATDDDCLTDFFHPEERFAEAVTESCKYRFVRISHLLVGVNGGSVTLRNVQ
jgi:hypothetical protein